MSLILSTFLIAFLAHEGSQMSLLSLVCFIVASMPYFFDGVMSLISILKQRVLTANIESTLDV